MLSGASHSGLTKNESYSMILSDNVIFHMKAYTPITATDLARNLSRVLDRLEFRHEQLAIIRNHHEVAKLIPSTPALTALEALSDLYQTLPNDEGEAWLRDLDRARKLGRTDELRDPWV